jgi:hypothetical protein
MSKELDSPLQDQGRTIHLAVLAIAPLLQCIGGQAFFLKGVQVLLLDRRENPCRVPASSISPGHRPNRFSALRRNVKKTA